MSVRSKDIGHIYIESRSPTRGKGEKTTWEMHVNEYETERGEQLVGSIEST